MYRTVMTGTGRFLNPGAVSVIHRFRALLNSPFQNDKMKMILLMEMQIWKKKNADNTEK